MRFWIQKEAKLCGPWTPEEIARLPDFTEQALVCPENRDPKNRKNWKFAKSFPEILSARLSAPAALTEPAGVVVPPGLSSENTGRRFFVRLRGKTFGPMPAEEILLLPGFAMRTLVCPVERSPTNRRNWAFARSFPDLRERAGAQALYGGMSAKLELWIDGMRDASPQAAAALQEAYAATAEAPAAWWLAPVAALIVAAILWKPQFRAAATARFRAESGPPAIARAARMVFPASMPSSQRRDLLRSVTVQKDGRGDVIRIAPDFRLTKSEAVFLFDERKRELRPLNDAAQTLLDFRRRQQ